LILKPKGSISVEPEAPSQEGAFCWGGADSRKKTNAGAAAQRCGHGVRISLRTVG
jgi:hypothetical protein